MRRFWINTNELTHYWVNRFAFERAMSGAWPAGFWGWLLYKTTRLYGPNDPGEEREIPF